MQHCKKVCLLELYSPLETKEVFEVNLARNGFLIIQGFLMVPGCFRSEISDEIQFGISTI